MKKLIRGLGFALALVLTFTSATAFAGLIDTRFSAHIPTSDVYDPINGIDLKLYGDLNLTSQLPPSTFSNDFQLNPGETANVLILETPDINISYHFQFIFNSNETVFVTSPFIVNPGEVSVFTFPDFNSVEIKLLSFAGQDFSQYETSGIDLLNIRYGTVGELTVTEVSEPAPAGVTLLSLGLLAIVGIGRIKKHKENKKN